MLALRIVLLVTLPGNGSSPTGGLTRVFGTTISEVPFYRVYWRVLVHDLYFLDQLGLKVDLLLGSYPRVDVHDPCDQLHDGAPQGCQDVVHLKIFVHVLKISSLCDQLLYLLRILNGKHLQLHVAVLQARHRDFPLLHLVDLCLYFCNGLPHLIGFEGDLGDLLQLLSVDVGHDNIYNRVV